MSYEYTFISKSRATPNLGVSSPIEISRATTILGVSSPIVIAIVNDFIYEELHNYIRYYIYANTN